MSMTKETRMFARNAVAALVLMLGLSGCLNLGGGKPPPTLFNLTAATSAPAGPLAGGALRQAIVVEQPEADRRLEVERVPVQVDDSNVAYVKDAQWVERPTRLFRSLLAETIRAKGRLVLEDDAIEAGGATHLAGRLLDMGYDARTRSAVVRYDAIRQVGTGPVATQRFEASVPVAEPKAASIGPALNQAANQVARQVADWIG